MSCEHGCNGCEDCVDFEPVAMSMFATSKDYHAALDASRGGAEAMARRFHETYEQLAPQFGYDTRVETRAFDPASPNGKLMIAVMETLFPATARGSCTCRWELPQKARPDFIAGLDAGLTDCAVKCQRLVSALCESIEAQNPPLRASKDEQFAEGFAAGMRTAAKRIANEVGSQT